MNKHPRLLQGPRLFILLGLLSVSCLGIALVAGSASISPTDIIALFYTNEPSVNQQIILQLRLPRALSAFAVGGLLALAGVLMQVLVRNPLGDPYILGVSGGAATAALLGMLIGISGNLLSLFAFSGAILSMLLVFSLSRRVGNWNPTRLLLTGVVLAAGWGAMISFLLAISPSRQLPGMLFWIMGDLSNAHHPQLPLLALCIGGVLAFILAGSLNLLIRGENQAAVLGVEIKPLQFGVFALASLLTAIAVTVSGSIGFVGLVIPHIFRLIGGSDHRRLIPGSILMGGSLLLLADTLARTLIAPQQLPVGVITAMLGVPLFLYLVNRQTP